ncbi:unnamed protein product [Oppiella nova]|uniref:F-box domain-containing protein n=1 Tax=Oppiella nova TaxID=334625 RepID=A0A7R9L8E7_9ACAR|nr:unnamed protein product [Oppiella nova]CAG2159133.1 unnamed protein product [Oppiella nova]
MDQVEDNECQQLRPTPTLPPICMNMTQEVHKYSKDSFNRFGDDLCGLLLSYLPLKESFGVKCVSKQWQRLVLVGHNTVDVIGWMQSVNGLNGQLVQHINYHALGSVLKKCPNMTTIRIEIHSPETFTLFETLVNAFKHLTAIEVHFHFSLDDQIVNTIIAKYGHRLTSIDMPYYKTSTLTSHTVPKLTQLSTHHLKMFNESNHLLHKNFTRIECHFFKLMDKVLPQILSLKSLRELRMAKVFQESNDSFIPFVKELATHCKQLVKLDRLRIRAKVEITRGIKESVNRLPKLIECRINNSVF